MPILDSQGNPVTVSTTRLSQAYNTRNTPLMSGERGSPGFTMLSRFGSRAELNQSGHFKKLAADIEAANPAMRSPLLNQSNFYMPESDGTTGEPNRLMNQWIAYYFKWHYLVGNIIGLHSEIPLSRFALRGVEDGEIMNYYEQMIESMELHSKCVELLKQYFLFGEVIPFLFWSDNYNCFTDLTFLDPNYVYVKGHYLLHSEEGDDVEFYELEPDIMLQNIVKSDDYVTKLLRQHLDADFIAAVRNNKRLLLSNFSTSMIKHRVRYADLRGTSIVLRCLKSLLYADKLKEATYSMADGHVNPKWIWKLGQSGDLATGGYMPSEDDLKAFRDLLVQANNDPIFTIITHYAVNVEAVGLAGKLLPVAQELSRVDEEILMALFANKAVTTGEGPSYACYDDQTETLTENGFKNIQDIKDDEKIATFNPTTEQLEYHLPISKHIYDYDSDRDGKMVHFKTGKIDICVTPNHRMYTRNRWCKLKDGPWGITRADEVTARSEFRSQIKWEGEYQEVPDDVKKLFGKDITLADWCALVGYFVSEGWTAENKEQRTNVVGIRQMQTSQHYSKVKASCEKFGFNVYQDSFGISGKDRVQYFNKEFGKGCLNKRIPKWMKNLPTPYLAILLNAAVNGDGSRRFNTKKKATNNLYYMYSSISKQLAEDIFEIVYKLGFVPKFTKDKVARPNCNIRHYVQWSDAATGRFPTLEAKHYNKGIKTIHRVDYKGRVYCFEVPNHLFITRRNGLVTIQGNTASVAFRTMMSRYIPIRARLERYLYQKVFAPVAYANKFYKRKEADLAHKVRTGEGVNVLVIPQIDWRSKANLLDDGSTKSIISTMVNSGRLPMKILIEALDLDYDEVRNYLYSEQATVFDNIAQKTRGKMADTQTDPTLLGQPFLPKTNSPVPIPPAVPKGKEAGKKFSNLLTIKPVKDDTQTQVNKGVPKTTEPEVVDPMKKALELDTTSSRIFGSEDDAYHKPINVNVIKKQFKDRKKVKETTSIKTEAKDA